VPILHLQSQGQGQTPDGKQVAVPPAVVLQQKGPVVQIIVGIQGAFAASLAQQGKPVPSPLSGLALIDTGASNTCIDEDAAKTIGLPVIDVGTMHSASHTRTPCNIYPVQFEIMPFKIRFESPRTMGAALREQGIMAIIGRDLLQVCTLFYNGLTGQITLSI